MALLARLDHPVHGPIEVVLDERGQRNIVQIRFSGKERTVAGQAWNDTIGRAAEVVFREFMEGATVSGEPGYIGSLFMRSLDLSAKRGMPVSLSPTAASECTHPSTTKERGPRGEDFGRRCDICNYLDD